MLRYLSAKIKLVISEAFSSEHSARTVAMKMATDNANELLQKLTLLRNKVRQASITQDMMEIISSAEALKG
ncbi:F0F1 ATP synthase subunit gamma [bacterium]|nr:MAG: F0F1 ATP synthase subunit gamma [bacterium]